MRIVRKMLDPSRPDAVRLRRAEKDAMLHLMNAATVMEDLQEDLADRLKMIENGTERLRKIGEETDRLLTELRVTVPENQRQSMENTARDCVVRIVPSATPFETNFVIEKEEFRMLVDSARTRCKECAEDDVSCEKCELFQLLTRVLPLDDYHSMLLCPYNLGKWKN